MKFSILILAIFCSPTILGQNTIDDFTTTIWRGFKHQWTYNHRINRLGDLFMPPSISIESYQHNAATGLGPDIGSYKSYYSEVNHSQIAIHSDTVSLELQGKEGVLIAKSKRLIIKLNNKMRNRTQYHAVLNGFDLISMEKADKMAHFKVELEKPTYHANNQTIELNLNTEALFDCQSMECELFKNTVHYKIIVSYLIFGADSLLKVDEFNFEQLQHWDKKNEPNLEIEKHQIQLSDPFCNATVIPAFRALSITLDRAHWYVHWNTSISNGQINHNNCTYNFETSFFFGQWKKHMRGNKNFPMYSLFAKKKKGAAQFNSNLLILQFSEATGKHFTQEGVSKKWSGWNKKSYTDTSSSKKTKK